jgi:diaminohydroxyphosphoribosylaminopyrimidine deaminase/5-amino-6-(5-phosphoribosylamino)uracil reductase
MTNDPTHAQRDTDEHWMSRALDLARQGVGLASPNPTVGCVLVKDHQVIGEGFHQYDRRDHAEIVALKQAREQAREQARNATAYVTLEPCSHHGRTGPCADALIDAQVARVVIATEDANPQVHGQGIAKLQAAGIEIATGVLKQPAQRLNDAFAKYIRTGLPYVTLKAAISLDGRIAPPASERKPNKVAWITGPESRQQVHLLRHSADAIITGIGTVLADDPLLTDRSGLPRSRPLLRVVLDSKLRLPLRSRLVHSPSYDLLVFYNRSPKKKLDTLDNAGILVKQLHPETRDKHLPLSRVLEELAKMKITSVLIEAGSQLNASFLESGMVDRLYLFYAPIFLGPEAQPLLAKAPTNQPTIQEVQLYKFGPDIALETNLNNPWQP